MKVKALPYDLVSSISLDVTLDGLSKSWVHAIKLSKMSPYEEFILTFKKGRLYLLGGSAKEEYIKENRGKVLVVLKNGIESWRR